MKMYWKSLTVAMMVVANLTSANANAGIAEVVESQAISAIESSDELKANLERMGYRNTAEAAKAFADAAKKAEEQGFDLNVGTLAVCAKGTIQLMYGKQGLICSTLFNVYEVSARLSGPGATLTLSAEGIYFYNATPHQKACYRGGRLEVGFAVNVNLEALAQVSCTGKRKYKAGFFAALGMGFGASLAISQSVIEVVHSGSYFDL
jgi:hypothetical protein